ncbi:MAG: NAD(P)H-dependent oxidoreductase [Candidatus Poribacteria bacterium]|nr:NAD(P)H-dependent oxidoreductase [Candidatus Poribacteria bacterium]
MSENDILIVGIGGSLRAGSYTRMAVAKALEGAASVGAQTKLIDLREYELIHADGEDDESHYPPGVQRLRDDVSAAHGIVLGTPEYHGGYSGVLKNAIDLMGFDEFRGKMVGLVGVSGGALGAVNALNSLRNIGRALHAWVVPSQASVPSAWNVFEEDGSMTDEGLEKRLMAVGQEVARFAFLHNSKQALEFLQVWESAPHNPGGV